MDFVCGILHWSRVTDSLAELTRDLVLRGEVDLLEQLGRDGQAARGLDLPQRIICIMVAIEMVAYRTSVSMRTSTFGPSESVTIREVFLERLAPGAVVGTLSVILYVRHDERLCL